MLLVLDEEGYRKVSENIGLDLMEKPLVLQEMGAQVLWKKIARWLTITQRDVFDLIVVNELNSLISIETVGYRGTLLKKQEKESLPRWMTEPYCEIIFILSFRRMRG